jgi:outer membrane protein assembly factor BamB/orotate phosphoribosyltransferase
MKRYEDLHEAIRSHAFVRSNETDPIVGSETTGRYDEWIFDFRALMLQAKWLDRYAEIFWELFEDRYPFQVGGMESASISLISAIVMKGHERGKRVNGFFIRKSRKRQGLMRQVEGVLTDEPVILVDDLINSGGTFDKQIQILRELNKKVSDVFVLLAFRDLASYGSLENDRVRLTALFTLEDFDLPLMQDAVGMPQDPFDIIWHFKAPHPSYHLVVQKSAPVIDDKRVYIGCDDGIFRALEQKTGRVIWEFSVGSHPRGKGILSSPKLWKGVLYFGAYDGSVYALEAATGKKVWTYDDADWIGSSPDIAPDLGLVFIGLEFGLFKKRGGIVALDMQTGTRKWTTYHSELTHGSPLYIKEESLVIIGSNDGVLYAYDAQGGVLRWRYQTRGEIKTSATYDPARQLVLVGSMDGTLYALSARDGVPVRARQTGAGIYSTPLIHAGTVYVASLDKNIYAINLETWKDRWLYATNGRIFATPALIKGTIWIGSNDGRLYGLDQKNGTLVGFFQATERIVNKIAYNEDTKRFFVPTQANEIYCIRKKL